jgi:hypothetical protein
MNSKLKIIESRWDEKAEVLRKCHPLKGLTNLPKMDGISPKTRSFFKAKGLLYLIWFDKHNLFRRFFFKRPLRYLFRLLRSYFKEKSFTREGDFFFYGLKDKKEFEKTASTENPLIILGFSYCHKPFECPSGRFSDQCQNSKDHPVCGQCFIGKCSTLAKEKQATLLYIPTVHYIGEKIFEACHQNPKREVLFLITACELTLSLFSDWGNMVGAKGIGVRLDGRICNTMKAFKLSEEGIKPGLTVVLDETKTTMLELIRSLPSRKDEPCETV